MLRPRFVAWMFLAGMMALGAGMASGQIYPSKPIRIVTAAPGSGNDFAARLMAPGLTGYLGQPVIVDNRGIIAIETVVKAPPDGYTLLFYGTVLWLAPFLRDNVSYDPVLDFSPVTWVTNSPNILVVHPSLPVKSVEALIALAKARPGELNYGSGSAGSTSHLAAELFKAMAGVNIVRISYKGAAPALNDVIAGQVHLIFPSASSVMPHVKSGRLRALAVASAEPSALAPNLPTVTASGLPGYESASILGMFAPAGTPATIIDRLNQGIAQALNREEVKQRLFNAGAEVVASSPERLAATVKSEMARLGKVIRNAGIRGE